MINLKKLIILVLIILINSCGLRENARPNDNVNKPPVGPLNTESCIEKGAKDSLEVVSWNIEHFPKSGDFTLKEVKKTITNMNMDLIAVQEISKPKQFDFLMSELNDYQGIYGENKYIRLGFIYNVKELEIVQTATELFKTQTVEFPRSPLSMKFKHKSTGEVFTAINIHLKCCSGQANIKRRKDAMALLKKYIDTNLAGESVIILGDFNEPLNVKDEYKNIYFQFQIDPNYFMSTDVLLNDPDSWSYPKWPSHLDQIIISGNLLKNKQVTDSMQLDDCDSTYIDKISDHRPVYIKFDQP
jgi:endonuclease/exonuclease/phosphatase family metal-dependent hydrolase